MINDIEKNGNFFKNLEVEEGLICEEKAVKSP